MNREPQTVKELFAKPRKLQALYNRAVQIPAEMRREGVTRAEASKKFGVPPDAVLDLIPSAFRKDRNGRYQVKPSDDLLRVLLIPSRKGLREIVVRGSREASFVNEYFRAVERYEKKRDPSALKRLRRKSVTDADGNVVRLLTNLEDLDRLAAAGVLNFESLYGRTR